MDELTKILAGQQTLLLAIVKSLHETGTMPIETLIGRIERTSAFGKLAFDRQPDEGTLRILSNLKELQAAYAQPQPPRPQPDGQGDQ